MASVNDTGLFTERPSIGDHYLSPHNERLEIASIWDGGVVFAGGLVVMAADLVTRFTLLSKANEYHLCPHVPDHHPG